MYTQIEKELSKITILLILLLIQVGKNTRTAALEALLEPLLNHTLLS